MQRILPKDTTLYRFDVIDTPKEWDSDFINPLFEYPQGDFGHKNKGSSGKWSDER